MIHIPWKDRYSIHYKEMDDQHQGLLTILNELAELVHQKADAEQVTGIFKRLCQYAIVHFNTEERYLKAIGYEGLPQQQAEHAWYIERILELDRSYDPSDPALLEETREFLMHWFVAHITKVDHDYAAALNTFYRRAEIRGIVFDFGKVIADFDNHLILERLTTICGLSIEELGKRIFQESSIIRDYESGSISSQQFMEEASRICGHAFTEEELIPIFTDIFTAIPSTLELIQSLKGRYKLGLISNTNEWHFQHQIQKSAAFPLFDAVSLSFQVKAMKPDPRIYQDVLDKLELVSEECVYIDDIPEYVQAAEKLLFHGIHYLGHEGLLEGLHQLKVTF